ncbi:hypothetical protein FOMPIDRAFT_1021875 [Fomitopsis schrenkii]|uniref:Uncharacterized protein n=1 Tax=Fomitopsis schrenkii TaxID=2126942 RepID=S8G385_FOMSC|nr:hypothetical protein FOMPIDRAFT_1021875 [Fomitopsis schrenkii]
MVCATFTGPTTPARVFSAIPAPSTGGTSAAGLLAHIARVQDQVAGLFARRLRDEVDRVPEAEMQRLETARWWVVHGALLSVMHLVYMHESDEVRRRFEWCVPP